MSESYEVVAAELTEQARLLDSLAAELRNANQSAQVSMTGDAYGQTGERFATMIEEVADAGRETLGVGVDALEAAGDTLRVTADAYEQQETDAAASLTGIGGELV